MAVTMSQGIPEASTLRVERILRRTRAEGPGLRAAVWVAGCSIGCTGCFNDHLWKTTSGREMATQDVASILFSDADIRGVTFLGGEPFDQALGVGALADEAQSRGLDVMTFTGFTLARLRARAQSEIGVARLLESTDLLVDGPFVQERLDRRRPWLGSSNQRFIPMTSRGQEMLPSNKDIDQVEITVHKDGSVQVNGWLSSQQRAELTAIIRG